MRKKYIGASVLGALAIVLTSSLTVNSENVSPSVSNAVALEAESEETSEVESETKVETKVKMRSENRVEIETETNVETEPETSVQDLINAERTALLNRREVTLEWYNEWLNFKKKWGIDDVPHNISSDELYLVQRCVETETYQAKFSGKVNVCSVIFNRLKVGGDFGNSLSEVITLPEQFTYFRTEISEDTKLAIFYYLEFGDTTGGCLYYHSFKEPIEFFGEYQFTDEIGHHFYK